MLLLNFKRRYLLKQRYLANTKASTAIIFSLSLFGIVASIGAAVDLSSAYGKKQEVQDAMDAAVLVAALKPTFTQTQMKTVADNALDKMIASRPINLLSTSLSKTTVGQATTLTYTSTIEAPTTMMGLVGVDSINIQTIAVADATVRDSEIVFVLDSTGSMASSSKMTNLKTSVDATLAGMLNASGVNTTQTKVAIVPFDTEVKIAPATNYNYIDYGTASNSEACKSSVNAYTCSILLDSYGKVCALVSDVAACKARAKLYSKTYSSGGKTYYQVKVLSYVNEGAGYRIYSYDETVYIQSGTAVLSAESGNNSYATNLNSYNATPSGFSAIALSALTYPVSLANGYGAKPATQYSTITNGKTRIINLPAIADQKSQWGGCIIDRTQAFDVSSDAALSINTNTLYPARPCANSNIVSMIGLTTDIAALRSKVQTLKPAGNTNITLGIQWGMEALSPDDPMTGGAEWSDPKYTKYMVIVTDGDNTQNRWTSSQSLIDARTAIACTNAKAKGIIVFTVRVIQGNSSLLQNCASNPNYYFNLSSATQLAQTMTDIMSSIKKIKLKQ